MFLGLRNKNSTNSTNNNTGLNKTSNNSCDNSCYTSSSILTPKNNTNSTNANKTNNQTEHEFKIIKGKKEKVSCDCSCENPNNNKTTPPPTNKNKCPPDGGDPYSKPPGNETGSEACKKDKKSTNALGHIGPNNLVITQFPYKLYSCDQVLIIEGYTFCDPTDYSTLKKSVFSLSAYVLNQFNDKNPDSLVNQIDFSRLNKPEPVFGAPSCIEFTNKDKSQKITLCTGNEKKSNKIIELWNEFNLCRNPKLVPKDVPISNIEIEKIGGLSIEGSIGGGASAEASMMQSLIVAKGSYYSWSSSASWSGSASFSSSSSWSSSSSSSSSFRGSSSSSSGFSLG